MNDDTDHMQPNSTSPPGPEECSSFALKFHELYKSTLDAYRDSLKTQLSELQETFYSFSQAHHVEKGEGLLVQEKLNAIRQELSQAQTWGIDGYAVGADVFWLSEWKETTHTPIAEDCRPTEFLEQLLKLWASQDSVVPDEHLSILNEPQPAETNPFAAFWATLDEDSWLKFLCLTEDVQQRAKNAGKAFAAAFVASTRRIIKRIVGGKRLSGSSTNLLNAWSAKGFRPYRTHSLDDDWIRFV
jgi:hypothetical protein